MTPACVQLTLNHHRSPRGICPFLEDTNQQTALPDAPIFIPTITIILGLLLLIICRPGRLGIRGMSYGGCWWPDHKQMSYLFLRTVSTVHKPFNPRTQNQSQSSKHNAQLDGCSRFGKVGQEGALETHRTQFSLENTLQRPANTLNICSQYSN